MLTVDSKELVGTTEYLTLYRVILSLEAPNYCL